MNKFEKAWQKYWEAGLSTSCVSNGVDSYPKNVIEFWNKNAFVHIKNNFKIIDLCSGGGGIPKLIKIYTEKKRMFSEIIMTDLSIIDHHSIKPSEYFNIQSYSKCNCEQLPFKSNSYDFVSSSFGIEYSNFEKSLNEAYRTLKPGGIFASVLHCYDSEIVKNSNKQLKQAKYILFDLEFFKKFKNIYLVKSKSKVLIKSKEKKLLMCLNDIKTQLLHNDGLHVFRMILEASHDVFNYGQNKSAMKSINYINKIEKSLYLNFQRMVNLAEAVLTENDLENISNMLTSLGFSTLYKQKITSNKSKILGLGVICKKL